MLGAKEMDPNMERVSQKLVSLRKSAVVSMRNSMLLYWQLDARKLLGGMKNDPTTIETSPGGPPFSPPSIPRMSQHEHSSINGQQAHCQARIVSAVALDLKCSMEC